MRMAAEVVLATALVAGGQAGADVPLAKDGKPVAVIVHNGFTNQAAALRGYLGKIIGAEPEVVATAGEAGGKPAIVLATADKLPGASERPEIAMQAYRIATDGQAVRLTGGSDLGLTYAVWGFLEDHLGCRFYSFKANGLSYAVERLKPLPLHGHVTLTKSERSTLAAAAAELL